jgi:hypothetical protein
MIRPLAPNVKTILKVATFLGVVAFVVFIWASARPVPIQVRVTFAGFTSVTNTETWVTTEAYFCVSNIGKFSVYGEGGYAHHIKNENEYLSRFTVARLHIPELSGWLKPGEFKTVSFVVPEEPLKVSLFFSKPHGRVGWLEKLVRNPPRVLRPVLQFIPARWLSDEIEVSSDWVEGRELVPVSTKMAYTPPTNAIHTSLPNFHTSLPNLKPKNPRFQQRIP